MKVFNIFALGENSNLSTVILIIDSKAEFIVFFAISRTKHVIINNIGRPNTTYLLSLNSFIFQALDYRICVVLSRETFSRWRNMKY